MTTVTTAASLTPEQQARWAQAALQPGAAVLARVDIDGPLDAGRLWAALAHLAQRHAVLSQRFGDTTGGAADVRAVLPWYSADLRVSGDAALQLAALAARLPEGGAALSALLLRTGDAAWTLGLAADPRALDAGSLRRLFDELATAYADPAALCDAAFAYRRMPGSPGLARRDGSAAVARPGGGDDVGTGVAVAAEREADNDAEDAEDADYADWRDAVQAEAGAEGAAYWQQALQAAREDSATDPPRWPLRQDAPRSAERLQARRDLPAPVHRALDQAGAGQPQRIERIAQAVWWLLLSRVSSQARFAAGWQHDARHDYPPMAEGLGVYDKVLPLGLSLDGVPTAAAWLARFELLAEAHTDAQECCPLTELPAGSLDVGFAFDAAALPRTAGGLHWHSHAWAGAMPCFALALVLRWHADGAEARVEADAANHASAAIEALLSQYLRLLAAVLAEPATPLVDLPIAGEAEAALHAGLIGPTLDVGTESLDRLIARWAVRTPQAPAIASTAAVLSHAGLQQQVAAMAAALRRDGVVPGARVALLLPRSAELLVAMLACWRAGAAFVPMDMDWPAARQAAVLADASPALVIDANRLAAWQAVSVAGTGTADADADAEAGAGAGAGAGATAAAVDSAGAAALADAAYVLYTSGSTGTPKGVVITHGALLNYAAGVSSALGLARCRRWGWTGTPAADLGHTALFGALFNGACLVVAEPADMADGGGFARWLRDGRADALKIVPSQLEALLDGWEPGGPRLPDTLVLGGEAAPRALVDRLAALAPHAQVHNHYGPTETTVGVMVHSVAPTDRGAVLPLSSVLPNNRVCLLDAQGRPAPVGTVAELFIGGAQLCRGYLSREADAAAADRDTDRATDRAAHAFVPDPLRPGERLYRSGDLAVLLPEGGLRLVGRADDQVKLRGFRIEPAEVEAALLAQPGVRQAAVVVSRLEGRPAELVAFVVADGPAATDWRARLADVLPSAMVPARCQAVDSLPRLANGKVDRRALAASAMPALLDDLPEDLPANPPTDPLEALVAAAMAPLLGRAAVGRDDDFFDLGGHSLLVIKLVARLRKRLQTEIAPALVFDHATPAALAAALRDAGATA